MPLVSPKLGQTGAATEAVEPSVSGSEIGAKEPRCSSWGSLPPSVTGSLVGAKQVALLKLGQLDPIGLWYCALCPIKRDAQIGFA